MEYHKIKDIVHVRTIFGHKSINSTLIYINIEEALFNNSIDEWIRRVSHRVQEETEPINANFTVVRSINETTAIDKRRK